MPDILDSAYVIVEYENGSRGILDLCMFAEGSRNEQEICVVGDAGKVLTIQLQISFCKSRLTYMSFELAPKGVCIHLFSQ